MTTHSKSNIVVQSKENEEQARDQKKAKRCPLCGIDFDGILARLDSLDSELQELRSLRPASLYRTLKQRPQTSD